MFTITYKCNLWLILLILLCGTTYLLCFVLNMLIMHNEVGVANLYNTRDTRESSELIRGTLTVSGGD